MAKSQNSQFSTALKGFAIGTADIIPGVSGGTVAFITGVYTPLINATASFGVAEIKALLRLLFLGFKSEVRKESLDVLRRMNWNLLLPLGIGLVCAILTMSRVMPYLLTEFPFYMYSLFFGLIFFSVSIPFREMDRGLKEFATVFVFTAISLLAFSEPGDTAGSTHPLYLFFCGALAICSMILPGISGSYVLVLLGQYRLVLDAIKAFDLLIVLPFIFGVFSGIILFTRVLKYLLKNHRSLTMAALTGFLLGSLKVLWPGQQSPAFLVETHETVIGVSLMIFGAGLLWCLERFSSRGTA